jgi:hypothetical protein
MNICPVGVSQVVPCNRQMDMIEVTVTFWSFLPVSKKVQLSICLTEHHDMKAYWGVLVLGQYHDTFFVLLWRMSLMPLIKRLGGLQSWS